MPDLTFEPGQCDQSVFDYVRAAVPELALRCGVTVDELMPLFEAALKACAGNIACNLNKGVVEITPEARALFERMGDLLISPESRLIGHEHVCDALEQRSNGANILVLQNHTSGADTLVFDALVRRMLSQSCGVDQMYWFAGHAINLWLVPLLISAGFRRVQIFSAKYKSLAVIEGSDNAATSMRTQNQRAFSELAPIVARGSTLVGLYPKGGRGESGLMFGEPRTIKIPRLLDMSSPNGLTILPTYVDGATSILPVRRGDDEFCEFLDWMQPGTAHVHVGEPLTWQDLQASEGEIDYFADQMDCCLDDGFQRIVGRVLAHANVMRSIAALAPNEDAKGPWADALWEARVVEYLQSLPM